MEFEKNWQKKFSEMAKTNGEDYQISLWSQEGLESYLKYFFEYFKPYIKNDNSQTLLLDLGCGPATFSKVLAEKGFRVYGVDYSEEMIEIAKKRTPGLKIDFKTADIYNLPFSDNFFDIVICLGVFQHLEEPKKAVREIKRVLRKDGFLAITALNSFSLSALLKKQAVDAGLLVKKYNPYEFKKSLFNQGFEAIKLKGIYFFPRPFVFLSRLTLKFKIYKLLNLLFPFFMVLSHSFYLEGKKAKSD